MRAPVSYGYLRPDPSRVQASAWSVTASDVGLTSPEALPNWDFGTDIHVERVLVVDVGGVLGDTGLAEGTALAALVTWSSSTTRIRGAGPLVELSQGLNRVMCTVPGSEAGGQLAVESRIVVRAVGGASSALAPRRPGSTLWSDSHRVLLEGSGTRFPTVPLPFSSSGLAGGRQGAWCLSVRADDLSATAAGAVCLYLNNEHPAVENMLENPDDGSAVLLAGVMRYDVLRQLVSLALEHEALDVLSAQEEGSLGNVLYNLLLRLFPDRVPAVLRTARRSDPGEFEAELQARAEFLS